MGRETGGVFRISSGKRQEKWPDGHENEWKFATDESGSLGHLQDMTEMWDKGGTQESMEVSLAVTHRNLSARVG